jgi:L,D-transpeptidase YcbB
MFRGISSLFRATAGAAAIFAVVTAVATGATINKGGNAGPVSTKTEVLSGKNVAPMLSATSAAALKAAEERYSAIVANGGWPKLTKTGLKKGVTGDAVEKLNNRLFIEGYLRAEGVQGEYAQTFTTATKDALARFQSNHGLVVSGQLDPRTLNALNVSAKERLATIRYNVPRLEIYQEKLGERYVVVNVPAAQIESVSSGRVYSRHNAIVGRPERPTPVVMTGISDVRFNPYWNAPASIVERDIIPKLKSGTSYLEEFDIKVFDGFGGPELDPGDIDWRDAVADDYHFRQEPGPQNAMATAKIDFKSPFGIYLHDTPEKQLFKSGSRFYSSGCVRVEKVDILLNWILNGQDGYNASKIAALAETLDRVDVEVAAQPQIRVVYLTAWPVGNTVAFRNDVYDLDTSGFTVGQPMPVGETSPDGTRYTLKPIPRLANEVNDGSWFFGGTARKDRKDAKPNVARNDNDEARSGVVLKNGVFVKTFVDSDKRAKPKLGKTADKKTKPSEKKSTLGVTWTSSNAKKPATKAVADKKIASGKKAKPETSKQVAAATNKDNKKTSAGAAAKKPASKSCVPAADGKLPKNCAPAANSPAKKPPAKTAAKPADKPAVAN